MTCFTPLLLALAPALPQDQVLIDLECRGIAALLPDAKDAGLRAALALLDERVLELVDDGDLPIPPAAIPLLARVLIEGPTRLTVGLSAEPIEGMPMPFYGRLALHEGSAEAAQDFAARVHDLFAGMGAPLPDEPDADGFYHVQEPPPGWFGARGEAFELFVGKRSLETAPIPSAPLPAGVNVSLAVELDLGRALQMVSEMENEPLPAFLQGLEGTRMRWLFGHDAERAYEHVALTGAGGWAREMGIVSAEPLAAADLRLVPVDAEWASVYALDPPRLLAWLVELAHMDGTDLLAEVESEVGLKLDEDLVNHLGSPMGVYASDTTGGGGWLSIAGFVGLRDPAGMQAGLDRLIERVNAEYDREADGYIEVRSFERGGVRCTAMTFPGLPVPFEPTIALVGEHLFFGATPQALDGAVAHARGTAPGFTSHPGLLAQLPGGAADLTGLSALSFVDVPRLLPDGYGMASLASAALANAVRSRADASAEPGLVLPPYAELARGARCMVEAQRVRGDDLLVTTTMDRSVVVNVTGVLGVIGEAPFAMMVPAAFLGLTATRTMSALEDARSGRARADIHTIHAALQLYAIKNGGNYPDDLEVLVMPDVNGARYLDREALPLDPWGNEYLYFPPEGDEDFRLLSYGADGVPGGEGDAADITLD